MRPDEVSAAVLRGHACNVQHKVLCRPIRELRAKSGRHGVKINDPWVGILLRKHHPDRRGEICHGVLRCHKLDMYKICNKANRQAGRQGGAGVSLEAPDLKRE